MNSTSSPCHNNPGQMDTKSVRYVVNSISRFIHLVSCQTVKAMPTQKSYRNVASLLKLLKPVLDDVVDCTIPSDEVLRKECEELDIAVNEAREFMESWSLKMSKIYSVLQSEPLVMKIQSSSLEICRILCGLLQSSPSTSTFTDVQHCMQELQCLKLERISECIEEALKSQRKGMVPPSEHLIRIIESLSLTSNQDFLRESIALEKERMMAQVNEVKGEIDQINNIIGLMSHIRDCMVKLEGFKAMNGVPIPLYFCCPLSLELMSDPVIVASGQTYDRASIHKWLDNGLSICPKTRQKLSHTNLIPNYTVKALIANWCEEYHIKFSNTPERTNTNMPLVSQSEDRSCQDLIHMDSFRCSSHSNDSISRSSLEVGNGFQKLKNDASFRFSEEESNGCRSRETENFDHSSPEQSYVHSRSESASSAFSSIDYLPAASTDVSRISGNAGAKENAAATLFSLSVLEEYKMKIGRSGAVKVLVDLLHTGSLRGKKDAATALFNLSIFHENKARIVQAGAVKYLVELMDPATEMVDKAIALLANLSTIAEGCTAIVRAGGIPFLIEVIETGSQRGKENAASILFQLCINSPKFCRLVLQEGAVPPLVSLSQSGTPRAKEKAQQLLSHFRNQREGPAGKGK